VIGSYPADLGDPGCWLAPASQRRKLAVSPQRDGTLGVGCAGLVAGADPLFSAWARLAASQASASMDK
jgi:hypothetical protein